MFNNSINFLVPLYVDGNILQMEQYHIYVYVYNLDIKRPMVIGLLVLQKGCKGRFPLVDVQFEVGSRFKMILGSSLKRLSVRVSTSREGRSFVTNLLSLLFYIRDSHLQIQDKKIKKQKYLIIIFLFLQMCVCVWHQSIQTEGWFV